MEQSSSWEANRSSVSQEIPRISWNQKVHYRILQVPASCPVLNHINPIHASPTAWRSILILSFHLHLGLSSGLFPSGLHTKNLYAPLLSAVCATCPIHHNILKIQNCTKNLLLHHHYTSRWSTTKATPWLALDISYHILNANKRDRKVYTNQGIATKLWLQTSTPHWYKETSSAKKKKRNYKFRAQGENLL